MANSYSQVSYGSSGSDVKTLQELLNQNGYSLDVDGRFGPATLAAVKDYQKSNQLDVDGIVGKNTWGALTAAISSGSTQTDAATDIDLETATGVDVATEENTAADTPTAGVGDTYSGYVESDAVKQAEALLQQQLSQQPGGYTSAWQDQLDEVINKILNREQFSYDLNGDALYQQYKDKYIQQGKMAMLDTMGQAQAMTGGYGNSYAQSVGQQAYQSELQNLNDIVPELYQLALDQYNQEGQDLYDQYSLLGAQDAQDYERYRDQVSDYYTEVGRLTDQYNTEREFDYGKYADDRAYEYQEGRNQTEDEQWQAEFDEAVRQFNYANGITDEDSSSSGTGTSGGNGGNGGGSYNQETAEQNSQPTEVESAMDSYVSAMLNGLLQHGGSQADPAQIINANSNLTEEEKRVALEILAAYLEGGYMGSP